MAYRVLITGNSSNGAGSWLMPNAGCAENPKLAIPSFTISCMRFNGGRRCFEDVYLTSIIIKLEHQIPNIAVQVCSNRGIGILGSAVRDLATLITTKSLKWLRVPQHQGRRYFTSSCLRLRLRLKLARLSNFERTARILVDTPFSTNKRFGDFPSGIMLLHIC